VATHGSVSNIFGGVPEGLTMIGKRRGACRLSCHWFEDFCGK